jgi:hypothetical protein
MPQGVKSALDSCEGRALRRKAVAHSW